MSIPLTIENQTDKLPIKWKIACFDMLITSRLELKCIGKANHTSPMWVLNFFFFFFFYVTQMILLSVSFGNNLFLPNESLLAMCREDIFITEFSVLF